MSSVYSMQQTCRACVTILLVTLPLEYCMVENIARMLHMTLHYAQDIITI